MRMIFIGLVLLTVFLAACTQVQELEQPSTEQSEQEAVVEEQQEKSLPDEETGVTETELSNHDSESDCWIGHEGKVYDITDWLPKHPGSALVISPYCGTSDDFESSFIGQHGKSKVEKLMQEGIYKGNLK